MEKLLITSNNDTDGDFGKDDCADEVGSDEESIDLVNTYVYDIKEFEANKVKLVELEKNNF